MKTCDICGYEAKSQGALNLHKYHCGMRQKIKSSNECSHEFRLLSSGDPDEKRAIENGFGEVCKTCQELR